jgi:hypothetical protein
MGLMAYPAHHEKLLGRGGKIPRSPGDRVIRHKTSSLDTRTILRCTFSETQMHLHRSSFVARQAELDHRAAGAHDVEAGGQRAPAGAWMTQAFILVSPRNLC